MYYSGIIFIIWITDVHVRFLRVLVENIIECACILGIIVDIISGENAVVIHKTAEITLTQTYHYLR